MVEKININLINKHMKNLITITPEKIDGKDCLKVELTIDGATKLNELINEERMLIHNFWEETLSENYLFEGNTIFTQQEIKWQPPQRILEFTTDLHILGTWKDNPKESIIFIADPKNKERQEEATAKLAAGMWAVYCNQKLADAILETNQRYGTVKAFYAKLIDAAKLLNFNNFKQDDKYYEKLKSCMTEAGKEMDFHIQKVNLMKIISKNDYFSVVPVNELYRAFRGINEEENKSNINVTSDIDENTEKETERANDPEGESPLRVV